MLQHESPSARFGSQLSTVLFRDSPDAVGAVRPSQMEALLVEEVRAFLEVCPDSAAKAAGVWLQEKVLPRLTAESGLAIAQSVEARFPWLIESIPILAMRKAHLRRAADLSESFGALRLQKLKTAIEAEADRT